MEQQEQIVQPKKATFMESLSSGIGGYFKGALAGGLVGVVSGAAIGAVVGLLTGGASLAVAGAAALVGAAYGGIILSGAGSVAGGMTGVMQSREKNQISARDVVNVATISYAQGMGVGHSVGKEQAAQEAQSHFRDQILKERAARGQDGHHVH